MRRTFVSLSLAVSVYWNLLFGFWSITNFSMMIRADERCTVPFSAINMIYHIVLIFGTFPAIVLVVSSFLVLIFLPYFIY